MHTESPLISIIVIGLGLAFVLGLVAHRLRMSVIVGYLVAGIAVGPFTPGFVADQALAIQLADIGVILLMFGVGLHFSVGDLLAVKAVAIPGALLQIAAATGLGLGLATLFGWPIGAGLIFGLCLSVASTVVLLRALEDRGLLAKRQGHLVVGWLVIQDLITVLALVLLPPFTPLILGGAGAPVATSELVWTVGWTLAKVIGFVALMLLVGLHAIPALLEVVARTMPRELLRLGVLSVALVVAFVATEVFGVSFALGAFIAGMVLNESEPGQQAAEEMLPLRDAFAVLFFVSVGMAFDPSVILRQPLQLLGALAVVMIGTPVVAFVLTRMLGESRSVALLVAGGLSQIGEFSFILAGLAIGLGILPNAVRAVILGASILSIFLNPIVMAGVAKIENLSRAAGEVEKPRVLD